MRLSIRKYSTDSCFHILTAEGQRAGRKNTLVCSAGEQRLRIRSALRITHILDSVFVTCQLNILTKEIKRLSERGVIKNENTIVSSLVSKEQIQTAEIEELVEKKFAGSIPAFLTAFTKSQQLTADEIQEMQQMIDRFREEHPDD